MADKLKVLSRLLGRRGKKNKNPTENPRVSPAFRKAFDTYLRGSTYLAQQFSAGSLDRYERFRDYEEMDQTPEIAQALNIYADDSCTYSEHDTVLDISSESERIVQELEELFFDRIDVEFYIWQWIRNLCKYGDNFGLLDISTDEGVLGVVSLPVAEIERVEGYDGNPNSVKFIWQTQGRVEFENYQISHMRILGDDRFAPLGRSILEPARIPWKMLCLESRTPILTSNGYKKIKDVKKNDFVFSYDYKNKQLIKVKVNNCWSTGIKEVFSLKTNNRELILTDDHGLIVLDKEGNVVEKKAKDIVLNEEYLLAPENLVEGLTDFIKEKVTSFESCNETASIWSLEVDHELHNYVANGIVSKNTMAEHAMLIYRFSRAPDRRTFYIDIGNIPPQDVDVYMKRVRDELNRSPLVDPNTGQIDYKYNPLSLMEDYYIPVRGDRGSRIEAMPGGSVLGEISDISYLQCFKGDTLIKLLDGTSKTIKEIVEQHKNKNMFVYSINPKTLQIEPAKIVGGTKSGVANKLIKITLDNGKEEICTPEHLWLLRDGSYKAAKELKINESLMPLYTKISSKENKNFLNGYEMFLELDKNRYSYTHRMVGKYKYADLYRTNILHHVDFFPLNNNPENLLWVKDRKTHSAIHAVFNKIQGKLLGCKNHNYKKHINFEDLINLASQSKTLKDLKEKVKNNFNVSIMVIKRLCKENGYDNLKVFGSKFFTTNTRYRKYEDLNIINKDEFIRIIKEKKIKTIGELAQILKIHPRKVSKYIKDNFNSTYRELYYREINELTIENTFKLLQEAKNKNETFNYVLDSFGVSQTKFKMFVNKYGYTITQLRSQFDIKEKENKKAFKKGQEPWNKNKTGIYSFDALNNLSIKAKNRYQNKGGLWEKNNKNIVNHKIINIEFIDNASEDVYDIEVSKNNNFALASGVFVHNSKLLTALGVPKSYLGSEADLSGKSTLSQEDIKFARTIQRIQKIVISELGKIALIHLNLRGFDEEELYNFDLHLTNPSTVMETMQLDLIDKRFDIAQKMYDSKLVDKKFIQKKVLSLSEFEMDEMKEGVKIDALERNVLTKMEEEGGDTGDEHGETGEGEGEENQTAAEKMTPKASVDKNPMAVPDATGTADLKHHPKASMNTGELINTKTNKNKKVKVDMFSRAITDVLRQDREMNAIVEGIQRDKEELGDKRLLMRTVLSEAKRKRSSSLNIEDIKKEIEEDNKKEE